MPTSDDIDSQKPALVRGLLDGLRDELLGCGLPETADVQFEDNRRHLMLFARRLALTAEVRDIVNGRIHAHVVAHVPSSPDGKTLDACVLGFGQTPEEAVRDAANIWLRSAAPPILSSIAGRPLLEGDHFEGHEPWCVPGAHGFAGPACVRGDADAIDMERLAESNFFEFEGYPRDGRPHLVKVVLFGNDGQWTRTLEIDGHEPARSNEAWPLGLPAPPTPVVCFRFAVFAFLDAAKAAPSPGAATGDRRKGCGLLAIAVAGLLVTGWATFLTLR
jgi:hypothetical protein